MVKIQEETVEPTGWKQTTYFITANTQQQGKKYETALIQLKDKFRERLEREGFYLLDLQGDQWTPVTADQWQDEELFQEVSWTWGVEAGSKQGRWHVHLLLKITHKAHLKMDLVKARQWFIQGVNYFYPEGAIANIYLSCKTFYSSADATRYALKAQAQTGGGGLAKEIRSLGI